MKKYKIILPILAILAYVIIIWPWSESVKTPSAQTYTKEVSEDSSSVKERIESLRKGDPNFKPKIVGKDYTIKNKDNKKSFFKTINEDALEYAATQEKAVLEDYGNTPSSTKEEIENSIQLQNAIKAAQDPSNNANQLTPLSNIKKFDREKYKSDPQYRNSYLSIAEPGRVFQSDNKSETKLKRLSNYYLEVEQGKTTQIQIQSVPGYPVSISSFDLGKFGNGLTHQTVEADNSGIATFIFHGVKGTIADTHILASSPVAKGQLKFIIHTKFNSEEISKRN